jgi:uncharacterized protein YraI
VPRGSHRAEPVERLLSRLPRQVAGPALGVGAVLLALALVLTLWPKTGPAPGSATLATAHDQRRDAALAADALRAASALRTERRASRDRTTSAGLATPVATAREPAPVPAVMGQMWATTDVTIRSGPSAGQDRFGNLKALTRIGITGVTKSGWIQVVTNGRAGWIRSTYLSRSKPKPKPMSASAGVSDVPCSISTAIESHLRSNGRSVYRAVCAAFGDSVSSFGGYRAGDGGDHGSGRAVDIMVSGEPGWVIARYVQAHARELSVTYVIYQQQIWLVGNPTSQWKVMQDRGSRTANHYDHVHVSVS